MPPVFAKLVAQLDYPMYVVTAAVGGERAGCLVGFGTQTSIHPPRFLGCISRKNRTLRVASEATLLGVHFLSDEPRERELGGAGDPASAPVSVQDQMAVKLMQSQGPGAWPNCA